MLIYIEKKIKDNQIAKNIISKFPNAQILEIDNYKNLFDKNISWEVEKCLIIAWVNNCITETPLNYWHDWKWFFFKNSLNCIYDCKYCYLKWAFKNINIPVIFVNYDYMKKQILDTVSKRKDNKTYWFYTSDYSDNLAIDNLTNFTQEFIPFFDTLNNVKAEIRTKSTNISNLLKIKPSKNIEIAFSLNPSEVIQKYELKTPFLDARINAINTLINQWWQVWVRFLPLLEIENYEKIYTKFIEYVVSKIDFDKVYSVFIWWLLYTRQNYNKILKREPYIDLFYKLQDSKDWYIREKREVRDFFYNLFDKYLTKQKCNRCLDK